MQATRIIQGFVDSHCRAISDDLVRYPLDPIGGTQSDWSASRPVTHQQLIAAMGAAGMPQAVVVQASTAYAHDNRYSEESVAAYPGRLAGVFSSDPLDADSPRAIRHWHGQGLRGSACSRPALPCLGSRLGSMIRAAMPPWRWRRSSACRSACRSRPRASRRCAA
jgi:hypothetical protein